MLSVLWSFRPLCHAPDRGEAGTNPVGQRDIVRRTDRTPRRNDIRGTRAGKWWGPKKTWRKRFVDYVVPPGPLVGGNKSLRLKVRGSGRRTALRSWPGIKKEGEARGVPENSS